jgi:hypothetical protein
MSTIDACKTEISLLSFQLLVVHEINLLTPHTRDQLLAVLKGRGRRGASAEFRREMSGERLGKFSKKSQIVPQ